MYPGYVYVLAAEKGSEDVFVRIGRTSSPTKRILDHLSSFGYYELFALYRTETMALAEKALLSYAQRLYQHRGDTFIVPRSSMISLASYLVEADLANSIDATSLQKTFPLWAIQSTGEAGTITITPSNLPRRLPK
jgi:hypothetical protein